MTGRLRPYEEMVSAWFQDCFVVPAPAPAAKRLLGRRLPMVSTRDTPIFRFPVYADIDGSGIGWFAIWGLRPHSGKEPVTGLLHIQCSTQPLINFRLGSFQFSTKLKNCGRN